MNSHRGFYAPSLCAGVDSGLDGGHFIENESEPLLEHMEPGGVGIHTINLEQDLQRLPSVHSLHCHLIHSWACR